MKSFFESESRYNEANAVLAVGTGIGILQQYGIAVDAVSSTRSAIAQRETVYNTHNSSITQLNTVAESVLYESVATKNINFEPRLEVEKLWRDIFPGDFVSVMNEDKEVFHMQLVEVGLSVSQSAGGSTIERLSTKFEQAVGYE